MTDCAYIDIEWPFNAPVPELHCLICGRVVADMGGCPTEPICPHVDLVWGGGAVQWVRPEWEPMVGEIIAQHEAARLAERRGEEHVDEEDLPDPIDAVIDADPEEPVLIVSCHSRGFGCGPVEDTCTVILRPTRGAYGRRGS